MTDTAKLAEELREFTAMKYAGDCKCGKCQLVPRALVERIYHTLNGTGAPSLPTQPDSTQGTVNADQVASAIYSAPGLYLSPADSKKAADAALNALKNVQKIITEASMTGFNYKDGNWPERLFHSQQATSAAIKTLSLPTQPARDEVREAVIEECAKIANDYTPAKHEGTLGAHVTGRTIEKAIRALAQSPKAGGK